MQVDASIAEKKVANYCCEQTACIIHLSGEVREGKEHTPFVVRASVNKENQCEQNIKSKMFLSLAICIFRVHSLHVEQIAISGCICHMHLHSSKWLHLLVRYFQWLDFTSIVINSVTDFFKFNMAIETFHIHSIDLWSLRDDCETNIIRHDSEI